MNDEMLKTLGDHELSQFVSKAQAELASRARKRKEEAIAKIKELAGLAGVSVSVKGARGRLPPRRLERNRGFYR